MSNTFGELRKINVNEHAEKKEGLTYLSWAWAWDTFKQHCPDATYLVLKDHNGLPYFESGAGAMVYTEVTAGGITHEMWLPVMDSKNKAMKAEPYTYMTRAGEKNVEAFTMFDVNKTIMRCLVKNLAMFGLALYIYAGEDLPDVEPEPVDLNPLLQAMHDATTEAELKTAYVAAIRAVNGNQDAMKTLETCKDTCKEIIAIKTIPQHQTKYEGQ
jgi:hypothetical protein